MPAARRCGPWRRNTGLARRRSGVRSMAKAQPSKRPAKGAKAPDLSRRLASTIKPTGGPAAQLETIADAAQLIADLEQWRQARPYWDRCAEMLLQAATTGRKPDGAEATRCIMVALEKENW